MAGDWIPMRCDLPEDPAVIALSLKLEVGEYVVVGALHRLWSWANQHTVDGNAPGVTDAWLDRFIGIPKFASTLASVGWLTITEAGISIPKFDEYNSQSAKARILTAKRVRKHRNAATVTQSLPEKRREENIISKKKEDCSEPPKAAAAEPPSDSIMEFPTVGKVRSWHLTATKAAEYKESYPHLNIVTECRQALQWCRDNPTKRKTARGMPAFLGRWLAKAQNGFRTGGFEPRQHKSAQEILDEVEQYRREHPE